MVEPNIGVDKGVLARLIAHGASFFPVEVTLDDNGKCIKKPKIKAWQQSATFGINRENLLNGYSAYGFHPETIGAVVIDLDDKGGKSGERELIDAVGEEFDEILRPSVYCDTPNGRHLYFKRAGLDPSLLVSKNGVLPGVDLRGHHSGGWLVAPGSVGWSLKRQEWQVYQLEGDLSALPEMPLQLQQLLLQKLAINATSVANTDTLPDFLQPARAEEMLPEPASDPAIAALFHLVSGAIRSPVFFERLVHIYAPEATRIGNDWCTGDYDGHPGTSCKWSPHTGIIKDFALPEKGGDFLWLVERRFGMLPVAAAKQIANDLGLYQPAPPGPAQPSQAEIIAQAATLVNAPQAPTTGDFPLTDSGNAERLVHNIKGKLLWNCSSQIWMSWDGRCWQRDEGGASIQREALLVVRGMAAEALAIEPTTPALADRQRALTKWATKCEAADRRSAMCKLATYDASITREEGDFDSNLDELNTLSGIVDLRTGTVRPHDPSALHTKVAPHHVDFEPPARFRWFLSEIMDMDPDLIEWMRQYLGYCLTGRTDDQVFPIWWGTGQNGKSVLLTVIGQVMGPYCKVTDAESWLAQVNNRSVRDDLAVLRGVRLAWTSEPEEGRRLAVSMVKKLTGGEPITCRFLYGKLFEFTPQFKTVFVTNHRPQIKSQDFAIWRRLRFVPFLYRVPEDRKDPRIAETLVEEEGARILGYLIGGAKDWYAAGKLPDCDKIKNATADLKDHDDVLADWLMDKGIISQSIAVAFDVAWNSYRAWNDSRGIKVYAGRNTFKTLLSEKAQFRLSKPAGHWLVSGLGIKDAD